MSSTAEPGARSAAVLTVSDSVVAGSRQDGSGPAVAAALEKAGDQVVARETVPDERNHIENALVRLCEQARLVVTTGGTGVATRDVTPEATLSVCDREVPGISQRMRAEGMKKTPLAALSRAVCGTRGSCLVLNLPGSPRGATESLASVIDVLPHALDLLAGKTAHSESSQDGA
jgi:molybdenum cofactor synthesis domain-containing protein